MDWPKCKECDGEKTVLIWGESVGVANAERKTCPKCNGTGERDLTADEAAKIIADYLYVKYGKNKVTVKRYSGQRNKKRVVLWRVETGICPDPFDGKGYEGYTEALNSACRAVRSKG